MRGAVEEFTILCIAVLCMFAVSTGHWIVALILLLLGCFFIFGLTKKFYE